jgi:oligogalacturonide lyase
MNRRFPLAAALCLVCTLCFRSVAQDAGPAEADLPREWVDADTGHKVVRLSRENGSQSLYFHQNGYTPDGKKLAITSPTGIYTIDLQSRQIHRVVEGRANLIMVGKKNGHIYYTKGGFGGPRTVHSIDPATRQEREIAKLPAGGTVTTVNSDETLLAGSVSYRPPADQARPAGPSTGARDAAGRTDLDARRNRRIPMDLLTIEISTGKTRTFNRSTEWLNHIQFSPTDPKLLMFCHEGPWHLVDRIWTINVTDADPKPTLIHDRTMKMEIAGHEFFSADGKTIWYDLQTPRSGVFWLAGLHLETRARTWYLVERDQWSVHYNISPDGKLFAGDGGGSRSVAQTTRGQWIYLFRPELSPTPANNTERDQSKLISPGVLRGERLVNLAKHDYRLEPNVTFTPDMKWVVFRSNMLGPTHVFAVEVAKSAAP